jgi:hypothetical protein
LPNPYPILRENLFLILEGGLQQGVVFLLTWRTARRAGQYVRHKADIDESFTTVGERRPAPKNNFPVFPKNNFPVSLTSLRTFCAAAQTIFSLCGILGGIKWGHYMGESKMGLL